MNDCIFCKIASKEFQSDLIYEDDKVIVFNDIQPQAPYHFLFVPKAHYNSLLEVDDPTLLSHIFSCVNRIVNEKKIAYFRTVINTGAEAGQSVFHLHIHVLAGRKMDWPPG